MVETTRAVVGLVEHGTLAAYPAVEVVVPHCGALLPAILDRWELFATLPAGQEGAGMSRTEESGSRELPAAGCSASGSTSPVLPCPTTPPR